MTEICEELRALGSILNHIGFKKAPVESTASDGLFNRSNEFFKDVYFTLVKSTFHFYRIVESTD
jgi:hypothetical protein